MAREPHSAPSKTDTKPQKAAPKKDDSRRDLVDETVWESFPASDPSGGWAGRDIPPDERKN